MVEVADLAINKWRSILPQLGVETKFLSGKHGPCPACDGKDRFRFDDRHGKGGFYCSGCGAGDGFQLLMRVNGWSFAEAADEVRAIVGDLPVGKAPRPQATDDDRRAQCNRLWKASREIQRGDPVADYLGARGLVGPFPRVLRFAPDCPISGVDGITRLPAMLAMVQAPDGSAATIHRTYLGDRCKADVPSPRRVMPGTIPTGSAIRLSDHGDKLAVAEGIETALAVARDFPLPCWSTLNATLLADFRWPTGLRQLSIFADHDAKFGGQAGAYSLAHRAATAKDGPEVSVCLPYKLGDDYLDQGNRKLEELAAMRAGQSQMRNAA